MSDQYEAGYDDGEMSDEELDAYAEHAEQDDDDDGGGRDADAAAFEQGAQWAQRERWTGDELDRIQESYGISDEESEELADSIHERARRRGIRYGDQAFVGVAEEVATEWRHSTAGARIAGAITSTQFRLGDKR